MKSKHSAALLCALLLPLGACGSTPSGPAYAPAGPPVALDEETVEAREPAEPASAEEPMEAASEPAPAGGDPVAAQAAAPASEPAEAAYGAAAPAQAPEKKARPASWRDPEELSLWGDPRFQRWVLESYAAEVDIEPGLTMIEREQLEKVLELMAEDQMDKALAQLEKLRGEAATAVFDFTLANIHFQREELEPAAEALEIAVEKYPKFRRAWQNLGVIRFRRGEHEEAIEGLTKVIELGGSNAVTFGMLGFAYTNVGNFLSAETAYRMAVLLDPATSDWKQGLSYSLLKQNRFAEAVTLTDSMLAEHPERAELWMSQANAYLGLEQPMKAAENFELVDRLGKSTAASMDRLGDIYVSQELYDLALGAYLRALHKDVDGGGARSVRAAKILASRGALEETGELVAAIEASALEMDQEQRKELLRLKARVAVARGAGEEQVAVLEEIVQLDPLDGQALILLAQHYESKDDFEQASFYFERAMNLEEHEADASIGMAQMLVRKGEYKEALPLLRRAQALDPRDNVAAFLEQIERHASAR